jgi:hypothetical protein
MHGSTLSPLQGRYRKVEKRQKTECVETHETPLTHIIINRMLDKAEPRPTCFAYAALMAAQAADSSVNKDLVLWLRLACKRNLALEN